MHAPARMGGEGGGLRECVCARVDGVGGGWGAGPGCVCRGCAGGGYL
jgi:hypothetical protein